MFKNLCTIAAVVFSMVSVARAEVGYSMPAIEIGIKMNTMDGTGATSNKQAQGFQGGGSIVFDFGDSGFGLKSGLMYSERPFKFQKGAVTSEGKLTYFDVPFQLMFKFEDYAGVFVGPLFSTKLGDECKNSDSSICTLNNIKSSMTPIAFGAQFKVASNFGLSLFFETASGEIAQEIKDSRAVGANLLFVFD